jgi:hypothetical protein
MSEEQESSTEDVENTEQEEKETTEKETEEEESTESEEVDEEEKEVEESPVKESRTNARIRDLNDKVNTLENLLLNSSFRQNQPNQPVEELPKFEDPEMEKAVNARINAIQNQNINALGAAIDKIDELEAKQSIPGFATIAEKVETFRKARINSTNRYMSRQEAYELMLAKGQITLPKKSSKVVLNKTKTKIANEKVREVAGKGSKKDFSKMSVKEQEAAFGNQSF